VRLWTAATVASFGLSITNLALPLTAALVLRATPWEMSVLVALETLPFTLCSLHAGVLVDRRPKRSLLMACDLGCGLSMLVIPIASSAGLLSVELLFAVAFLSGGLGVVGGAAQQVLLAAVAGERRLVEANAKIGLGEHSASLIGPGVAGWLVELLTAPLAVAVGAASHFASALLLRGAVVRADVPRAAPSGSVLGEISEGIAFLRGSTTLRALALLSCASQFLHQMLFAVVILFASRDLALSGGAIGAAFVCGGAGSLGAASIAQRLSARLGATPSIVLGFGATALGWQAIGLIRGPTWVAAVALGASLLVCDFGGTLYGINYVALRQELTPVHLRGRVTATMRFFAVSSAPLGSIAGGSLATRVGVRATLLTAGALGLALFAATAAWSPLRRRRLDP
jgi:MFS family permease